MSGERTILFYGNCQAFYLHRVFSEQLAPLTGDTAVCLGMGAVDFRNPAHAAAFRDADVLVDQVFDTPDPIPADLLPAKQLRLRMPNLRGDFLWPFGTRELHPNHRQFPKHTQKFYGEELGDGFLNRMILERVPEREAVDRYLGSEVARPEKIARIYELSLDRQRRRDRIAGIDVADFIADNLPTQSLFGSPGHPREALLHRIARPVLRDLVGPTLAKQALQGQYHGFSWNTAPIHPNVARQLCLKYIFDHTRYLVHEEEFLTFEEYAYRYLRGGSVPELWEAVAGFGKLETAATLALLDRALEKAPLSPRAHRLRSRVLRDLGRTEDAVGAAWRAVSVEPEEQPNWGALVTAHLDNRQIALAEAVARLAVSRFPRHASTYHDLCEVLVAKRDARDFAVVARKAKALHPGFERGLLSIARQWRTLGESSAADTIVEEARRLRSRPPPTAAIAADMFERQGRRPEAIAALRAALAAAPNDADLHGRLAHLLHRDGDFTGAEAAFRRAAALAPGNAGFHSGLAEVLDWQGRRAEAVAVVRAALAAAPNDAPLHGRLAHLLSRDDDVAGAEAAYRQAIALAPSDARLHHGLAELLARAERRADAVAVLRAFLATGRDDAQTRARLTRLSG